MRVFVKTLLLACLLLGAIDTLNANSQIAGTLKLISPGTDTMGGVYVGPYEFSFTPTGSKTSTIVYLVCDDFKDQISVGESWTVAETQLSSLSSSTSVLFGNTNKSGYDEVDWLYDQMLATLANNKLSSSAKQTDVGEIQWAIWDIFDPKACSSKTGATAISNCDPYGTLTSSEIKAINTYVSEAEACVSSSNSKCVYANNIIYSPDPDAAPKGFKTAPQEFLGVVPEPGTLVLLGTGLCSLLGLRRRFSL
jgi:hypothetical protein